MSDKRAVLIQEMVQACLDAPNGSGIKEALAVAEKYLAEKHAMIAEEAGATMDEHICVLCGEIAAAIRMSVGGEND